LDEAERKRLCPLSNAHKLERNSRKIFQNPHRILKPYIKEGMTVMDFGCGPGFYTIEMANLIKDTGKVYAVDLQEGMLDLLKQKIKGTEAEKNIVFHKCEKDKIGLTDKFDFILAFYVVHEVPSQENLFKEFKSLLKPEGKILIYEPKSRVTKSEFAQMIETLKSIGFEIISSRRFLYSRSVVIMNKKLQGKRNLY
jgi:ubiquinone/menaquinone biosynthesis C-methylase UbiE